MRRLLLLVCVVLGLAQTASADPLKFGISRPYGADAAKAAAEVLDGYLGSALKRPVQTVVFDGYEALAAALAQGKVDAAWITPLSYVESARGSGVVPIAKAMRRKSMFYKSCIVTRADARYTKLADLKGARAAWVDKTSTSGHLVPKGMLLKDGVSLTGFFASESFAGDHKSACSAVASGQADVAGTFTDAEGTDRRPVGCEELGGAAMAGLKCLAVSDNIANEVIAGRPELDESVAGELGGLFAGLSETEAGRKVLTSVFRTEGFGFAMDEDFEPIRKIAQAVAAGRWPSEAAKAAAVDPKAKPAKGAKAAPGKPAAKPVKTK